MKNSGYSSSTDARRRVIWYKIGLVMVIVVALGVCVQLQKDEAPAPAMTALTDSIPNPTATSTSLTRSVQVTSTATEVLTPTSTRQAVVTQPLSPTVRVRPSPTMTVTLPPETPTPQPANVIRLVITTIGVDAPVVVVGVRDGVMESPSSPTEVGWYDFSAHPGAEGNTVFAGHYDFAGVGPAVFYRLGDLLEGDTIEVYTDDGGVAAYRVTSQLTHPGDEDINPYISHTTTPTITLITCDGIFDSILRQYDERLIVVGELITESE